MTTTAIQTARAENAARIAARDAAIALMPTISAEFVAAEWRGLNTLAAADVDGE